MSKKTGARRQASFHQLVTWLFVVLLYIYEGAAEYFLTEEKESWKNRLFLVGKLWAMIQHWCYHSIRDSPYSSPRYTSPNHSFITWLTFLWCPTFRPLSPVSFAPLRPMGIMSPSDFWFIRKKIFFSNFQFVNLFFLYTMQFFLLTSFTTDFF